MRPRLNRASSLTNARRAAVVAVLASLAVIFIPAGSAKPTPSGTYSVCMVAGNGSGACSATTGGGDYSIVSALAKGLQVTIKNETGNQTLDYVNLNVPAAIGTINTSLSASATNYSAYASTSTSTVLQLRNLGLAVGTSKTIAFVMNPAGSCTDGQWTSLAQSAATGNFFTFPAPTITGGMTTLVSASCALQFSPQPTAALQGAIVSSQAYTAVDNVNAFNVAVTPVGLPVALNGSTVTFASTGDLDPAPGNTGGLQGLDAAPFSGGSVVLTGLKSTATGGPFTITASAPGFDTNAVSSPFVITQDGKQCNGACTVTSKAGNNPLVSISTSNGFAFVGSSPSNVLTNADGSLPAGCANWTPLGVPGFVEFDQRTPGGTLTISYYVSQSAIKARYGKNTGQQFIPICFGAKQVVHNVAVDCTADSPTWTGDVLDTNGAFTGAQTQSVCGPGGYEWAILGSYQDKVIDPASNPLVTGFNGPTNVGQNFRTFVITEPPSWDGRGTS